MIYNEDTAQSGSSVHMHILYQHDHGSCHDIIQTGRHYSGECQLEPLAQIILILQSIWSHPFISV
jgi:hypothetical protein